MKFEIPYIYPVTDASISGLSHSEQVEKLIAGGATLIQLREKHASPQDFYESALQAIQTARRHDVKIIINDRVDIALAVKADGVHLGQGDLPPAEARKILGSDAIIGFSTHSLEQAIAALKLPIDYLAFGPVFKTQTKENLDPDVRIEGLKEVRRAIGDFPLVAIGGINAGNLDGVFDAGADSAAMIGALAAEPDDIEQRMRAFLGLILR